MRFVVALLFIMLANNTGAQHWQISLLTGGTNYKGDLQQKFYDLQQSHFTIGVAGTYVYNQFSLRAQVYKGNLSANDKYSKVDSLVSRNLSFGTRLYEVSATGKYNLTDPAAHLISPYVFAGLSIFRTNPYTVDQNGTRQYLIPFSTEGQGIAQYPERLPESWYNWSLPFGAGVEFQLSEKISVELEVGYRKTFTDYVDDVSTTYVDPFVLLTERGPTALEMSYRGGELTGGSTTYPLPGTMRGDASAKDWYYATILRFNYLIGGRKSTSGGKNYQRQTACPTVY